MEENLKELQLKDLCGRLSYGVKIKTPRGIYTVDAVSIEGLFSITNDNKTLDDLTPHDGHYWLPIADDYKPYLRPLSSMTEEEKNECFGRTMTIDIVKTSQQVIDWLLKNHFDFRGLIEKDLALPAPEGMYEKIK
jgi:hypothetical protein